MQYLEYPLFAEGFINRFLSTGVFTKEQKFAKATLQGKVNEWLEKGFSIHENPCRKEFVAKRLQNCPDYLDLGKKVPGDRVEVFGLRKSLKLYFPFRNIGVENSGFYYTPTYLRSYHYAVVAAGTDETAAFELSTCGGMTVWVNGALVCDYTPFTRNMVKHTTVHIPLKRSRNEFLVCHDDLAERDTDYYFRIRYMGSQKLSIRVPVPDGADGEGIRSAERMLDDISFEKEAYIGEPVDLLLGGEAQKDFFVDLTTAHGEFIELMEKPESLIRTKRLLLKKGSRLLRLFEADELLPSYYYFTVSVTVDGVSVGRTVGNQVFSKEFLRMRGKTLRERKTQALETICRYGVDNVYKSAALLALGRDAEQAGAIVLKELRGIRKRKDCSDFHFIIVLYLYGRFGERLSGDVKKAIRDTAVSYRYWIDEPGDDVMWFFSENHALLFHVCQYLAGVYFRDEVFTNSGRSGSEVRRRAEAHLEEWFGNFFREFITEWNSNAYIPIDILGIATLYNLTDGENQFHRMAKKALDMIFRSLCINAHKGAVMTSFGRTYEKELKGNYNAGTTAILYLMYGVGYMNRAAVGYLALALGDYEAPEEYRRYIAPADGRELIAMNTQGYKRHVNLYLYKNGRVLLSTAVGYKPFRPGYQEHIMEAAIDETAFVFVNHPGESHPYGSGRPNFWAGNGVLPLAAQYRDMSILSYDIPETDRIDYTHAYVPLSEFRGYQGDGTTLAVEKDGAYIGLVAENGIWMEDRGPTKYREFISMGRKDTWIIKVALAQDYETLEEFFMELKLLVIEHPADAVSVTDKSGNRYILKKDGGLSVNGKSVYRYPLSAEGILSEDKI
ncbi:MAG: hypothetical protein LKJ21_07490 [Oscillospiraceae bacterium]|nr:hypothetical protein [Oscillospiraceae bacterium]